MRRTCHTRQRGTHVTIEASNAHIIDQRGMSIAERFDLALVLRGLWWDCHRHFADEIVDLTELGLTSASLAALAADLETAGYVGHARRVESMEHPLRVGVRRAVGRRCAPHRRATERARG